MQKMHELWLTCIPGGLSKEFVFSFRIPKLYDTRINAEEDVSNYKIKPIFMNRFEVGFQIYMRFKEDFILVDTIEWKEYWKYKCITIGEKGDSTTLADLFPEVNWDKLADISCSSPEDYIPCSDKFEDIYWTYSIYDISDNISFMDINILAYDIKEFDFA